MTRPTAGAKLFLLAAAVLLASRSIAASEPAPPFRGVFFNPQTNADPNFPWLLHYGDCREEVRAALRELVDTLQVNLVAVFILIPNTLKDPPHGNESGQALEAWANMAFLDHVAAFVDDCHAAGLSVAFDLADNRWIPHRVDATRHLGQPGNPWWPVADETPWDEAASWYRQIIEYVESHAAHPEAIAFWCMGGNYQWGGAEPVLWDNDSLPEVKAHTERFVKHVWPVFRAAGRRPKAAPYALPIFSNNAYWMAKSPKERLGAFLNLKQWLVDDLALPPDYWPMTTYPFCDPAPDGVHYLREIIAILGEENAGRILSTDLKGPGHAHELRDSILNVGDASGPDMLQWHFDQCMAHGFAGWWVWAYQDAGKEVSGVRARDGAWKQDLVGVIRQSVP